MKIILLYEPSWSSGGRKGKIFTVEDCPENKDDVYLTGDAKGVKFVVPIVDLTDTSLTSILE